MMAYSKPQQRKGKGGRLTGERDKIKFIDLGFEREHVVALRKGRRGQEIHKLHVLNP